MTGVQTCALDRKSTRLNSSHTIISYAVFCLKKKNNHVPALSDASRAPHCSPVDHRRRAPGVSGLGEMWWPLTRHRTGVFGSIFFFLNNPAPPKISPLPHPDPFPI